MTSVEIPYSIAAALPTLTVLDITNDVSREVAAPGHEHGIAYVHRRSTPSRSSASRSARPASSPTSRSCSTRLVPAGRATSASGCSALLLGPRTEQIPFADGALCLGQWQRILLSASSDRCQPRVELTLWLA